MQEVQPLQETPSFIFGKGGKKIKRRVPGVIWRCFRRAGRVGGRCLWKVTASCCGSGWCVPARAACKTVAVAVSGTAVGVVLRACRRRRRCSAREAGTVRTDKELRWRAGVHETLPINSQGELMLFPTKCSLEMLAINCLFRIKLIIVK